MNRNDIDKPTLKEARLYIIMRRDLYDMNSGKLGAQAAHAATKFVFDVLETSGAHGAVLRQDMDDWRAQGGGGFGTKITLHATLADMKATVAFMDGLKSGIMSGIVVDTSYPYRTVLGEVYVAEEATCMYVFAPKHMPQEALDYLRKFPLHP
jgi:peptidyl-tRNA hydrolase